MRTSIARCGESSPDENFKWPRGHTCENSSLSGASARKGEPAEKSTKAGGCDGYGDQAAYSLAAESHPGVSVSVSDKT